jgi:hypothetical protein
LRQVKITRIETSIRVPLNRMMPGIGWKPTPMVRKPALQVWKEKASDSSDAGLLVE